MKLMKLILLSGATLLLQSLNGFEIEKNIPKSNPSAGKTLTYLCHKYESEIESGFTSLRKEMMLTLKDLFKIKSFVESGTFLGGTTLEASKIFDKAYTVELSKELYLLARKTLSSCSNTRIYLGNSGILFYHILRNIPGPILLYLDGHWSEQNTAKGKSVTPIMDEIAAIKACKKNDCVIMIDDIRLFQESLYPEKIQGTCRDGYPPLSKVIQAILNINQGYQFCFLSDSMIAFPPNLSISVSPLVRACALQRLSAFYPDIDSNLLHETANIISMASNIELYDLIANSNHAKHESAIGGWFCYDILWHGLTLMNTEREDEGISMIRELFENCLPKYKPELLLGDFYGKVFPEKMGLSSI